MDGCIFCRIVNGEVPSVKIYEDDDVLSFLDISPANKGHALVIPKKHFELLTDVPDDLLAKVIQIVKMLSASVVEGTESEGFNIVCNNKAVSGQMVPHVHFHIIPRFSGDGLHMDWKHEKYAEGEINFYQRKIKEKI